MATLEERLNAFRDENKMANGKGALAFAIQFTRRIRNEPFPLDPTDYLTKGKGQVSKISGANCNKILKEYGVPQRLASEAGRTNRGTITLMENYVSFLNEWAQEETIDFCAVECYWVECIKHYFNNQPFVLAADASKTVVANLNDLFNQAKKRQEENPGMQYLGTVLQHLVAAKLCVIMPDQIEVHGASVADAPTARSGDFVINKTIIHCTTSVGDLLLSKCESNINNGYKPVIITIYERVQATLSRIEDAGLAGRVEVWDIQQFLSSNVHEHSFFDDEKRNATLGAIIENYNQIVLEKETDPSLRIEFEAR